MSIGKPICLACCMFTSCVFQFGSAESFADALFFVVLSYYCFYVMHDFIFLGLVFCLLVVLVFLRLFCGLV